MKVLKILFTITLLVSLCSTSIIPYFSSISTTYAEWDWQGWANDASANYGGNGDNFSNIVVAVSSPTLSVSRPTTTLTVGQPSTVTWATTGATALTFGCSGAFSTPAGTSPGGGVGGGSRTDIMLAAWVGQTTCTWTATWPTGLVTTFTDSFNINPAPLSYTAGPYSDAQSGLRGSPTGNLARTFTTTGIDQFVVTDRRGNTRTCDPLAALSAWVLVPSGACMPYVIPYQVCPAGYYWNGNSGECNYDNGPGGPGGGTGGGSSTINTPVSYSETACTRQSVTVSAPGASTTVSNSPISGELAVTDTSGLVIPVPYTVNNIDIVMPTFGSVLIQGLSPGSATMLANDTVALKISATDPKDPRLRAICWDDLTVTATLSGPMTASSTTTIQANGSLADLTPIAVNRSGVYALNLTITDRAGNVTTQSIPNALTIYPNFFDPSQSTLELTGGGTWVSGGNGNAGGRYANGTDSYEYRATLRDRFGNPIVGKSLISANQVGASTIRTDMRDPSAPVGADAVIETVWGVSNADGQVNFTVKWLNGGTFTESFDLGINEWNSSYIDTTARTYRITNPRTNTFKKPFTASLWVVSQPNTLQIGALQNTRIMTAAPGWTNSAPSYSLAPISVPQLTPSTGHRVTVLTPGYTASDTFAGNNMPEYTTRMEAVTSTTADTAPSTTFNVGPFISYTVGGVIVQSRLSPSTSDSAYLTLSWVGFTGLAVEWATQAVGRQTEVNSNAGSAAIRENFSDVSVSSVRSSIRKNAYELTRGMISGSTVNNVRFVVGDYTLDATPTYETLVVRNGNLKIMSNINVPKFGIIVLQEDDETKWNVYISSDVGYIKSLIYADGSVQSANASGVPYTGDTLTRTNDLQKQLVIYGSLITRNTIGGALLSSEWVYRLPVNVSETPSFDTAVKYDLNYLRRWVQGADQSRYGDAANATKPTVIRYNPSALKSPPKGFFSR